MDGAPNGPFNKIKYEIVQYHPTGQFTKIKYETVQGMYPIGKFNRITHGMSVRMF